MRVRSGAELAGRAEVADAYNCVCDDEIVDKPKEVAAKLFDYLNDYGDAAAFYSNVDKLHVHHELGTLLCDLEALGAIVYSAVRHASVLGKDWPNQTSLLVNILYLVVQLKDKVIVQFVGFEIRQCQTFNLRGICFQPRVTSSRMEISPVPPAPLSAVIVDN
jgi:hypothetical protein